MNALLLLTIAEPLYLMLGKSVNLAKRHIFKFWLMTSTCALPLLITSAFAVSDPSTNYDGLVPYEKEVTILVSCSAVSVGLVTVVCSFLLVITITRFKLHQEIRQPRK